MDTDLLEKKELLKRKRYVVFLLTFVAYACFHMTRKIPGIVKSVLHPKNSYNVTTNPGWAPFNNDLVPSVVAEEGYFVSGMGDVYNGKYSCSYAMNKLLCKHPNFHLNNVTLSLQHGNPSDINCPESWVIHDNSSEQYYFQIYSGNGIPTATVDDKGKWTKGNVFKRECKGQGDDIAKVVPVTQSGNLLLGELDTVFLGFYSVGLFVSGHLGDRLDLRIFLTVGMVGTSICFIMLGLSYYFHIHSSFYFVVFNAFGGLFQSIGWPCVVAIMARWFGQGNRGFVMGIWNSNTSVGNIMGSVFTSLCLTIGMHGKSWPLGFILPSLLLGLVGCLIFLFLEPTPPDDLIQLIKDEETHSNALEEPLIEEEQEIIEEEEFEEYVEHAKQSGFTGFLQALMIPGVLTYAFCLAFAKLTAYSLMYWGPYYLAHVGFSSEVAGYMSTFFDVGGIIGGILCGYISDRYRVRALVAFSFLLVSVPILWGYYATTNAAKDDFWINAIAMTITGIFVNGPYALITTAVATDLGSHESLKGDAQLLASVTGIIDGTGSLGATVQGVLIGLISTSSWKKVFTFLMICNLISALLVIRLVVNELKHKCRSFREVS